MRRRRVSVQQLDALKGEAESLVRADFAKNAPEVIFDWLDVLVAEEETKLTA